MFCQTWIALARSESHIPQFALHDPSDAAMQVIYISVRMITFMATLPRAGGSNRIERTAVSTSAAVDTSGCSTPSVSEATLHDTPIPEAFPQRLYELADNPLCPMHGYPAVGTLWTAAAALESGAAKRLVLVV